MISAPTPMTSRANREPSPSSRRVKLTSRDGIHRSDVVTVPPRRVVSTAGVSINPSTRNAAARKYPVSRPKRRPRAGTPRLSPAIPARTTTRITAHTARARLGRDGVRSDDGRGRSCRPACHDRSADQGFRLRSVDICPSPLIGRQRPNRGAPRASARLTQVGAARSRGLMISGPVSTGAGSGTRTRTPSRADAFEASMSADSIIPAGPNYCTGLLFLLSKRDRAGEETDVSEAQQAEAVRRRVLIAEDEALIRLDLAEMLAEEGYEVVGEAGDGETAVRLAHELRPDLVILDIKMPVMDGLAAAEKIAEAHLAPVLILTAFSQRDLVERARAVGAMAYLVKPFQ